MVTSLKHGNINALMTKDVLDYKMDNVYAKVPTLNLSIVPAFLDSFHPYSCLYWPCHLSESKNHQLSTPFQTTSLNFIIGEQQTASTPLCLEATTFELPGVFSIETIRGRMTYLLIEESSIG